MVGTQIATSGVGRARMAVWLFVVAVSVFLAIFVVAVWNLRWFRVEIRLPMIRMWFEGSK
jgi:hypothetical protein